MKENKKRIVLLAHPTLVPPDRASPQEVKHADWRAEYQVLSTLRELGYDVLPVGLLDDLNKVRIAVEEHRPHIAFNMMEEFDGVGFFDQNVVSYLELVKLRYTGCNPRGLMLARDKSLAKKILTYHQIPTPEFAVFTRGAPIKRPRDLGFPLIVKSVNEEASLGIAQASVVYDDDKLGERVRYVHDALSSDALVESYIEGRELYVGLLGNGKVEALPIWELYFDNVAEGSAPIATARVKWDEAYRKRRGIRSAEAKTLSEDLRSQAHSICRKAYRALGLNGYARLDLRLSKEGNFFLLEANPNPHIGVEEDFAQSALKAGLTYPELLERIVRLGLRWRPTG